MKKLVIILALAACAIPLKSQDMLNFRLDKNGDTLFVEKLRPIVVYYFKGRKTNSKEWREFYRTVYNFNKVYPFALVAKDKILYADSLLNSAKYKSRQKEKIIHQMEKALFEEFEKPMRNLTVTQGAMLMRLIDREVGVSSYNIIKGYRGNTTAGLWQGVARLFGNNLKIPYDRYGKDKLVEELVLAFQNGTFFDIYASVFGYNRACRECNAPGASERKPLTYGPQ